MLIQLLKCIDSSEYFGKYLLESIIFFAEYMSKIIDSKGHIEENMLLNLEPWTVVLVA